MWKECVIDATMGVRGGLFCFCPIQGDINGHFDIITGMNYLSEKPPENLKFVAVIHEDGQEAVEAFCKQYQVELDAMKGSEMGNK